MMRDAVIVAALLAAIMALLTVALYIGNSPPEARTSQEQSMEVA